MFLTTWYFVALFPPGKIQLFAMYVRKRFMKQISFIVCFMSLSVKTLRIGGRTWSDYYNQFLGNILYYPMRTMNSHDPIRYCTAKDLARDRLILLILITANTKASGVPNIYLSWKRVLKMNLMKSRGKDDMLNICKLSGFEIQQVRYILGSLP